MKKNEGKQNEPLMRIMENFCDRSGIFRGWFSRKKPTEADIREFDMQHEQWLFGEKKYGGSKWIKKQEIIRFVKRCPM